MSDIVERLKDAFNSSAVCHCGSGIGECDNHDFCWMEDEDTRMLLDAQHDIERLRARVAEREADIADYKKLIADELAETLKLFAVVGLNEADDFGTKTAIEAVRERVESIKADRDSWKREALAWRAWKKCVVNYWTAENPDPQPLIDEMKAARAANGEVGNE